MTIRLTPCIVMNGNAKEAVHFYERVLDAKVLQIQTYGEMPVACPDALKECVANAILKIGESELMLFDAPAKPIPNGNKDRETEQQVHDNDKSVVTINISINDVARSKQIFGILQQGGKIIAPLEEVPFSPAFGTVTDKFGVTFIILTQV